MRNCEWGIYHLGGGGGINCALVITGLNSSDGTALPGITIPLPAASCGWITYFFGSRVLVNALPIRVCFSPAKSIKTQSQQNFSKAKKKKLFAKTLRNSWAGSGYRLFTDRQQEFLKLAAKTLAIFHAQKLCGPSIFLHVTRFRKIKIQYVLQIR